MKCENCQMSAAGMQQCRASQLLLAPKEMWSPRSVLGETAEAQEDIWGFNASVGETFFNICGGESVSFSAELSVHLSRRWPKARRCKS